MTFQEAKDYLCDRLKEASTWQGIGFLISLCGGRWAIELDWGAAACFGGGISALIKMVFPDKKAEG